MQTILIGGGLLFLAAIAFAAVMTLGRIALAKWDAHQVMGRARDVEREATRREVDKRRFVMDGSLRGTKAGT